MKLDKFKLGLGIYFVDGTGEGGNSGGEGGNSAISSDNALTIDQQIPEKFRVFEGEGDAAKFNLEGSALKLSKSYSELERKGGAPDSPDDYSIESSESLGDKFDFTEFKADDTNKAFLKSMHAAGLNNSQVQKVLEYGMSELIPGLMGGEKALSSDEAIAHMKAEVWPNQADYARNMQASNRAYLSLPPALQKSVNDAIGNDPTFLQVMALFGVEMKEDKPPQGVQADMSGKDIEDVMKSDAYKDPKHPDHARVSADVRAHFEKNAPKS